MEIHPPTALHAFTHPTTSPSLPSTIPSIIIIIDYCNVIIWIARCDQKHDAYE